MSKKKRILAIDPGTREMGVAVLENGSLIYHGVETFRKLPSPQDRLRQGRSAVARLIRDFRPTVLVVEKTFIGRNRNATLLNVLGDEIGALGRRHGITVVSLAPNTVKKAVAGYGWATKADVAKAITARYPKLKAYLPPGRKWKQQRHYNMFDAVALGIACLSATKTCRRSISSHPIRAP
jgi:crossover junction endodeoxyribonuclease RuvC